MRENLFGQMDERKKQTEYEKKWEYEQLGMWNKENDEFFRQQKEEAENVFN